MRERPIGERLHEEPPERARTTLGVEARRLWQVMTIYERFEQLVALVLSGLIAVVIIVALVELVRVVTHMLATETLDVLEPETFQLVFGMIMTVLIALEFKHSIVKVALRNESIIQVKTVILIALIALARKFVVLEEQASPAKVAAMAGALLALGLVYWLVRERDDSAARRGMRAGSGGQAGTRAPGRARE